jgi:hypothetical protein
MNDLEHARTGTSAVGRPRARALPGGDRRGRAAEAPKFGVVDVVAQHDEEADEELARDSNSGLRAPAAVAQRAVGAFEIGVEPRGVEGRLAEDPAEQRAALFGDMAESIFVGFGRGRSARRAPSGPRRRGPTTGPRKRVVSPRTVASTSASPDHMADQHDHPGRKESEHSQSPQPCGVVNLDGLAGSADTCLCRDRADEPRRCRQQPGRTGHELRSHARGGAEEADKGHEPGGQQRDQPEGPVGVRVA